MLGHLGKNGMVFLQHLVQRDQARLFGNNPVCRARSFRGEGEYDLAALRRYLLMGVDCGFCEQILRFRSNKAGRSSTWVTVVNN